MSELINTRKSQHDFHHGLLSTVSAAALLASISSASANGDTNRPTIWIELGGQFERVEDGQQAFAPPFFSSAIPAVLAPMVDVQKQPLNSFGEYGKITFDPTGSHWLISASVRYGRSSATRHSHYETVRQIVPITLLGGAHPEIQRDEFGDGQGGTQDTHLELDFQVGKDVGLGLYGVRGTSVLNAGVRFAQFTSGSDVTLHARPTYASTVRVRPGKYTTHYNHFSTNTAIIQSRRSVHALGPEISWDASLPVLGDNASMDVALDWGVNAAVLFGRQRTQIHHQTAGYYHKGFAIRNGGYHSTYVNAPVDRSRSRSVTIPNIGGFAGVSFRYANAKVSFGYRGDFFFNAMDTGWDAHESSTASFYGPFANISIGLGG